MKKEETKKAPAAASPSTHSELVEHLAAMKIESAES
jgi:hypothetical protein